MKLAAGIGVLATTSILASVFFLNVSAPPATQTETNKFASTEQFIEVYSLPNCGCCGEYGRYLGSSGFQVKSIKTENLDYIKRSLGVPPSMGSCHTSKIGRYFVEGHVPVEAIHKLLKESPEIYGVRLPGIPSGSPGMGSMKTGEFITYSVSEKGISVFMKI